MGFLKIFISNNYYISMKKLLTICLVIIFSLICNLNSLSSQCSGTLILLNNNDLENYIQNNPNCRNFKGTVHLKNDFSDVDRFFGAFDTIESVIIQDSKLDSFIVPLNKEIGKYYIHDNASLSRINLRSNSEGGSLDVEGNTHLTSMSLSFLQIFFYYVKTDTLLKVNIEREAQIYHHVTNGNVIYTGKKLKMYFQYDLNENDSLYNFSKILEHFILDSIDNIRIFNRKKFDCDGVEDIQQINGLYFSNIDTLSLEGFDGVSQTINAFYMGKCHSVFDFQPMAKTKANYISLVNNNGLESLAGLPVSKQLYGLLLVRNENLSDISRLQEVETFVDDFVETNDRVWIKDNPKISFCSYPAICDLVVNLGPPYVNISGNVMDCLDNEGVNAACITSAEEDDSPKKLWIYLDGIGLIIQSEEVLQLNIYDVNGKWVNSWDHLSEGTLLDVSFLAAGLYVVQTANLAGHLSSGKLVKSI